MILKKKMAHIVCMTSGLTGILNASFELMRRLEADGHRVTCACPQPVGEQVRAQGFAYLQLLPVNYEPAPALPEFRGFFKKGKRLFYKYSNRKKRQAEAISNLKMNDFAERLKNIEADLWIVDVELHEHLMTLVAKEQPILLLSQWFSLWHRRGLPSLLSETIPGEGWRGSRLGLWWAWCKIKAQRFWIFFKKRILSGGTDRRSVLKKYAEQIGFSKKYIRENYWPGPFTYAELPVISMTAEELEFLHDLRPNLKYVGPMVFENRKDTQTDDAVDQKLNHLFLQKKEDEQSLIYCSVSTFRQGDRRFLKKLIAAVAERKDWMLILGLGGMLETDFLNPLPKNVHAFGWIPQLKVLAEADLSINHGGIHTINECLHFRVPMLVYSGKRSDQNGCAARVHFHKVGIMADKDVDDSVAIRQKIERLLTDESFRRKAVEFSEISEKYKKEKRLETIIEESYTKNEINV